MLGEREAILGNPISAEVIMVGAPNRWTEKSLTSFGTVVKPPPHLPHPILLRACDRELPPDNSPFC